MGSTWGSQILTGSNFLSKRFSGGFFCEFKERDVDGAQWILKSRDMGKDVPDIMSYPNPPSDDDDIVFSSGIRSY